MNQFMKDDILDTVRRGPDKFQVEMDHVLVVDTASPPSLHSLDLHLRTLYTMLPNDLHGVVKYLVEFHLSMFSIPVVKEFFNDLR